MYTISTQRWKKLRSRGMFHFIWSEGLFFWAGLGSLLFAVLIFGISELSWTQRIIYSLAGMLGLLTIGFLYGVMIWREQQKIHLHDEPDFILSREIKKLVTTENIASSTSIESMFAEKPVNPEVTKELHQYLMIAKDRYEGVE